MTDADDRRLLERIAARDRVAFETFFRAHGAAVHRFVRDLVRDDGLAEELTSDVMVEVWRSAGKYGGRSRVRTWAFGIAHHKAIDALRRRRTATVPLDELLGVADRGRGARGGRAARRRPAPARRRAGDALGRAPRGAGADLRRGLLAAEIAEIVSCPVATVKTRAFYAKQRLRDALAATAEQAR